MKISFTTPDFQRDKFFQQTQHIGRNAFSLIVIAPIIYIMLVPIIVFDLTTTLYQQIIFRLLKIPLVKRKEYIIIDRHHLSYLSPLEKVNCVYCGYGNGVTAYTREIIARTEQRWCPIQHAKPLKAPHSRYKNFLPYESAEEYQYNLDFIVHSPYDD